MWKLEYVTQEYFIPYHPYHDKVDPFGSYIITTIYSKNIRSLILSETDIWVHTTKTCMLYYISVIILSSICMARYSHPMGVLWARLPRQHVTVDILVLIGAHLDAYDVDIVSIIQYNSNTYILSDVDATFNLFAEFDSHLSWEEISM